MRREPYSWEDASYLTRRSLGVPFEQWRDLGKDTLPSSNLYNQISFITKWTKSDVSL